MSKITIDTDIWVTQQAKANATIGKSGKPVRIQYISKLIKSGRLVSWKIDQLGVVLVKR